MASEWVILHGGALGDLVLTIQLALRMIDPRHTTDCGLRVISRTNPGDLAACVPSIIRTSSEAIGLHWAYADSAAPPPDALRRALAGRHVITAFGESEAPAVRRLRTLHPASLCSFEPAPQPGSFRHITEQWATQLEAQGLLAPKCLRRRGATSIRTPPALRRRGRVTLAAAVRDGDERAVCVMHPGSGGTLKCWALEGFIALARALQTACATAFVAGPAELERGVVDALRTRGPEIPVIASTDANELAAVVAAADVYVGNDAGPTHLAALLGTPTVALFGPTPHQVWRPLGAAVEVLVGRPREEAACWRLGADDVAARVVARLHERAKAAADADAAQRWSGTT